MKDNNNKRKIVIGSIVGAIILLFVIVGVVYSKGNNKTEVEPEVATSEQVNIDTVTSDVAEAAKGDTIEDTSSTTASTEEVTEASTEASSEEVVEAVIETSTDNTDTTVVEATVAEADVTESVQVSTATSGTLTGETGPNGWPIIEYNGSADGKGPGLAWVKGVDYLAKESIMNGTYDGVVAFTASNGVTIKAVLYHSPDGQPLYEPISCDARGKDLEPNSPWSVAVKEAREPYLGKEDLSANVNATLPNTSYKRNSIDPNDSSVVEYKKAYDYKRATLNGGQYYGSKFDTINDSIFFFTDGVGEYDKKGNPLWEFRNNGSYWSLVIYQNPAEYQWSGIKEVLEYLSPDGAALYQLFYEDYYYGRTDVIPTFDDWYSYGSSQVLVPEAATYSSWYFK